MEDFDRTEASQDCASEPASPARWHGDDPFEPDELARTTIVRGAPFMPMQSSVTRGWHGFLLETYAGWGDGSCVVEYPYHSITLQTRGVRRVTQNRYGRSREDVTRGGTLIITGRGPRKEWITHGERGCEFVRVRLSHRLFKAALGERGHSGGDAEIIDNFGTRDPAIEALLLQLLREFREDAFCSALCAEAIVQQIVVHLLRRYSSLSKVPDVRVQRLTPAKLARVTEYIDGNLAAELTTADVAAVVSMGAGHFAKCFRHTMGMTPHEFVAQKRIARARELLLEKERSIADIAYQVGFSAPSHFSTAFTRNVGITPRAYRRSASK